ncbi:unnamed protein product [Closterium sp. Yama58-4]|nr:unnamed protein product [Closterium sp. Yama58-4]
MHTAAVLRERGGDRMGDGARAGEEEALPAEAMARQQLREALGMVGSGGDGYGDGEGGREGGDGGELTAAEMARRRLQEALGVVGSGDVDGEGNGNGGGNEGRELTAAEMARRRLLEALGGDEEDEDDWLGDDMGLGAAVVAARRISMNSWSSSATPSRTSMQLNGFLCQEMAELAQRLPPSPPRCLLFSPADLETITDGFSQENLLGSGAYGPVYRGWLDPANYGAPAGGGGESSEGAQHGNQSSNRSGNQSSNQTFNHTGNRSGNESTNGLEVAVKVHRSGSKQEAIEAFVREVDILLRVQHTHIVCLVGRSEVASALLCLHQSHPPILHRDLKPDNILLDQSRTSKVADVGLSCVVPSSNVVFTRKVRGTIGFIDPEAVESGELTTKSDVYAYGVVLMLLLTRFPAARDLHRYLSSLPFDVLRSPPASKLFQHNQNTPSYSSTTAMAVTRLFLACILLLAATSASAQRGPPGGSRPGGQGPGGARGGPDGPGGAPGGPGGPAGAPGGEPRGPPLNLTVVGNLTADVGARLANCSADQEILDGRFHLAIFKNATGNYNLVVDALLVGAAGGPPDSLAIVQGAVCDSSASAALALPVSASDWQQRAGWWLLHAEARLDAFLENADAATVEALLAVVPNATLPQGGGRGGRGGGGSGAGGAGKGQGSRRMGLGVGRLLLRTLAPAKQGGKQQGGQPQGGQQQPPSAGAISGGFPGVGASGGMNSTVTGYAVLAGSSASGVTWGGQLMGVKFPVAPSTA